MRHLADKLLWLAVIGFLGTGVAFLVMPQPLADLVDMPLNSPSARIDFLATYGGLQSGIGVFLFICTRRKERTRLGFVATGCAMGGFASGRLFGLLTTPAPKPIIYMYLALEVMTTAVAFWLARIAALTERRPD